MSALGPPGGQSLIILSQNLNMALQFNTTLLLMREGILSFFSPLKFIYDYFEQASANLLDGARLLQTLLDDFQKC